MNKMTFISLCLLMLMIGVGCIAAVNGNTNGHGVTIEGKGSSIDLIKPHCVSIVNDSVTGVEIHKVVTSKVIVPKFAFSGFESKATNIQEENVDEVCPDVAPGECSTVGPYYLENTQQI